MVQDHGGDEVALALPPPDGGVNVHPLYEIGGFKQVGRGPDGRGLGNSRGHLFPSALAIRPGILDWSPAQRVLIAAGGVRVAAGGHELTPQRLLTGATFNYANIVPTYRPWDEIIWNDMEKAVANLVDRCWRHVSGDHQRWHYVAGRGLKRYGYLQAGVLPDAAVDAGAAARAARDSFFGVADADLVAFPTTMWGIIAGRLALHNHQAALPDRTVAIAWVCTVLPAISSDFAPRPPCTFMSVATLMSDHLQGWDPIPGLAGDVNPWEGWIGRTSARKNADLAALFPRVAEQDGAVGLDASKCNPAVHPRLFDIVAAPAAGGTLRPAAWRVESTAARQ